MVASLRALAVSRSWCTYPFFQVVFAPQHRCDAGVRKKSANEAPQGKSTDADLKDCLKMSISDSATRSPHPDSRLHNVPTGEETVQTAQDTSRNVRPNRDDARWCLVCSTMYTQSLLSK